VTQINGKFLLRFISFPRRLKQMASCFLSSLVKEWILRKDGEELEFLNCL